MGAGALVALGEGLGGAGHAPFYSRPDRPPGGRRRPFAARLRPVCCYRLLAQHFRGLAYRIGAALFPGAPGSSGGGAVGDRGMLLGVILILASTFAYNGAVVLLAAEMRRQRPEGSSRLIAVSRRGPGLFAIFLNVAGGVLEIAALAFIPLTLARVLSVAGLGILLGLTRWALKEPLGPSVFVGVGLIALGIAAVSFAPPSLDTTPPTLGEWSLVIVVLGLASLLPYALRFLRQPVGPNLGAVCAGLAYALGGIFSKGAAEVVSPDQLL